MPCPILTRAVRCEGPVLTHQQPHQHVWIVVFKGWLRSVLVDFTGEDLESYAADAEPRCDRAAGDVPWL